MSTLNIAALVDNLDTVLDFVHASLEQTDCPMRTQLQIDLAVEEVYVNIASYAYGDTTGDCHINCTLSQDPTGIIITLIDEGVAYNPLLKEDADITLPADERGTGGLGILLTKKVMSEVTYQRTATSNMLTLKKFWP